MIVDDLAPLATSIERLRQLAVNPRRGDVDAIARSLHTFGQRKPVVAARDGTIIAGNHTVQAALALGWDELAVVWVDDDDTTAHAYALADNRTAELGGYDDAALAALIAEVRAVDATLLAATGWNDDDLADLLAKMAPPPLPVDIDDVPAAAPAITQPGDVWQLGEHRLMCGDCRNPEAVARLLADARVNLAVTSPPYAEQRAYDPASGFEPIPPDRYVEWFAPVAANVAAHLADDGSWLVNIKPPADGLDTDLYVLDLVAAHVRRWGWHYATEFCWERTGVPKGPVLRLKNGFEPVYQFTRNRWKFRPDHVRHPTDHVITPVGPGGGNTARDGRQGGNAAFFKPEQLAKKRKSNSDRQGDTDDDWFAGQYVEGLAYPTNRLPTFAGTHEATGHGAAFPVGLPQFFTRLFTDAGDTVYDPFVGSGSTLLAVHAEERRGYGMEVSAGYVDITCKRFERTTGIVPVIDATGEERTFLDG